MSEETKHVFWFDLRLSYEELKELDKLARKYTNGNHMRFLEKILREAIEKEKSNVK